MVNDLDLQIKVPKNYIFHEKGVYKEMFSSTIPMKEYEPFNKFGYTEFSWSSIDFRHSLFVMGLSAAVACCISKDIHNTISVHKYIIFNK